MYKIVVILLIFQNRYLKNTFSENNILDNMEKSSWLDLIEQLHVITIDTFQTNI